MQFLLIAVVGCLFIIDSTVAITNPQIILLKSFVCGRLAKPKSDKIVKCIDGFDMPAEIKKFDAAVDECCKGVHLQDQGAAVREWLCKNRLNALGECGNCVQDKIYAQWSDDLYDAMNPFKDCVMEAVGM